MKKNKNIILSAPYSVIEPLGLLHLASTATKEGWTPKIHLVKDNNFGNLEKEIKKTDPQFVGFSIYTGNHQKVFKFSDQLRKKNQKIKVIMGGPHATYFSKESAKHSNYVVLSQGFDGLKRILTGEAPEGIVHLRKLEKFPISKRDQFYHDHPEHDNSEIKSVITRMGCPYRCTYCYNSSSIDDLDIQLSKKDFKEMKSALGSSGRLFPIVQRPVKDVMNEIYNIIKISPETKRIYFQDDIFGANLNWLEQFSKEYTKIDIPFHAQMRFEFLDPKKKNGRKRLKLLSESGCDGLTFAIESAIPEIRKEILNREMPNSLMFEVFEKLNERKYKVRTEQMLGLPYGATITQTPIGLEADLETLKLNVELKERTGLPTMAWASIFIPYLGTKLGQYCIKYGYYSGTNKDIPSSFFKESILNFTHKWVGPNLSKQTSGAWMGKEEKETHKIKLKLLKDLFSTFALIPEGHSLARSFLSGKYTGYGELSRAIRHHLYDKVLYTTE